MLQEHVAMETKVRFFSTWMAVGLFSSMIMTTSRATFVNPAVGPSAQPRIFDKYDYKRYQEVQRKCQSIISSPSKLKYDVGLVSSIKDELSFNDGDWKQDSHGMKSLLPIPKHNAGEILHHSASFSVLDVKQSRLNPSVVKVLGSLRMVIGDEFAVLYNKSFSFPADDTSQFKFSPGFSSLSILFEGMYAESEAHGQRIMCMLGKTSIPSPKMDPDSSQAKDLENPWRTDANQFSLMQDDKILMVLRYPKFLSLTNRAIYGEVSSLHDLKDSGYFDMIKLSSQLGPGSNYQFGSDELIFKTCSSYLHRNNSPSTEIQIKESSQVCELLYRFGSGSFSIVPNWKCNSTAEYCNRIGPFGSSNVIGEANITNKERMDIKLYAEDIKCEAQSAQDRVSSAKVSAVFRAMTSMERPKRSSLDDTTLSAEGTWNSDCGKLCMVGCLGRDDKKCDSRLLIHFSLNFSISQRNVIVGSISNSNGSGADSYYPLSFERTMHPWEFQNFNYLLMKASYTYTKIKMAGSFLERNEPFDFNAFVMKSLLKYPKVEGNEGKAFSLSNLAEDLSFHARVVSNSMDVYNFIQMDIYTIGSLLGHSWHMSEPEEQSHAKSVSTEKELLLNISATLSVKGNKEQFNISRLFLEGLYNPADGKMYLIGCRDARAPQKVLFDSYDLENGLDCLVEVKVEYPPVTAKWLVSQSVKISISSSRNDDDPLHFSPIELHTSPVAYHSQLEGIMSQRNVEGVLQVLVLSMAVACIFSQLRFIGNNSSSLPFMSMVALGVLALGYSIPLISGAHTLFFGRKSKSHSNSFEVLEDHQSSYLIDYLVKFLFLAAFLLTARLIHKVWKSRRRLLAHMSLEEGRVPDDKWVFLACLCIHLVGFLMVVGINMISKRSNVQARFFDRSGYHHMSRGGWGIKLEEYLGMVQDFFLLPQVIGNILWQLESKPLRKTYYMGITVLRILPHAYDFIVSPSIYPYVMEEYLEFASPDMDFFGKFGDTAIPIVASLLAFIVFCQQRWNCQKLYRLLGLGCVRISHVGSRAYGRLSTMSHEAELVGLNENHDGRQSEREEQQ